MSDKLTYDQLAQRVRELEKTESALKRAELALRESESRYFSLFAKSPIAIELYDAEGGMIKANPACAALFGVADDRALMGFDLFADPNLPEGQKDALKNGRIIRYQIPFDFDKVKALDLYPTSRSGIIWLDVLIAPLGRPERTGYLAQIQDITERKLAEEALQETGRRLRMAQRISRLGHCTWNVESGALILSEGLREMLGYDPSEAIDFPRVNAEIHHPDDLERVTKWLQDCIASGGGDLMPNEYRLIRKNGEIMWVRTVGLISRSDTRDAMVFATLQDITERKKAESTILQLQKSKSLGRMAGAVAHNFNNLLQVVIGRLEMALDDLNDAFPASCHLDHAMGAARRAVELSGLMLAYLGHSPVERTPIDLFDVCRQTLLTFRSDLPPAVFLAVDLPETGPIALANAAQIQQMLRNLVINASESLGDEAGNSPAGVITVSGRVLPPEAIPPDYRPVEFKGSADAYCCLSVRDGGRGVAEEDIEKLFDPFYSTKFTGRGLGLPVALGAVRAHDGCIAVETAPGRGSVFSVYLPVMGEAGRAA